MDDPQFKQHEQIGADKFVAKFAEHLGSGVELRDDYKQALKETDIYMKAVSDKVFDDCLEKRIDDLKEVCRNQERFRPRLTLMLAKGLEINQPELRPHHIDIPDDIWTENAEIAIYAVGHATACAKAAAVAVFLETEIWAIKNKEAAIDILKRLDRGEKINIKDHPDRVEGIIVAGTTMDDRNNNASFLVKRSKENKIILNKPATIVYATPGRVYEPTAKCLFTQQSFMQKFYQGYFSAMKDHPDLQEVRDLVQKIQEHENKQAGKKSDFNLN